MVGIRNILPNFIAHKRIKASKYMMKRLTCLLMAVIFSLPLSAQSRAVVKYLAAGECNKAKEKYAKIEPKDIEKSPDLYALASAMLLNAECDIFRKPMVAYETFSRAYDRILLSADVTKALKAAKLNFDDVKRQFEHSSAEELYRIDRVADYEWYIPLAEQAQHNDLIEIKRRYELCAYNESVAANTIDDFSIFLEKFPNSSYGSDVVLRRTHLYFDEAMKSNSEARVEVFLLDYPDYSRVDEAKRHLADLRFDRVLRDNKLADLRWFTEQYPDYPRLQQVWQAMANIEFSVLDGRDIEAMRSFTQRYPTVSQTPMLVKKVKIADMVNACDVKGMFEYIRTEGYDDNYLRFMRAIAQKQGYLILTPNIQKVDMVRFRNADNKIGYMDMEGNVVVVPNYTAGSAMPYWGDEDTMPMEFKQGRGLAVVCEGGKWGVINARGGYVVRPNFQSVGFIGDRISCVVRSDDNGEIIKTYCNEYDFAGKLVQSNRRYESYCNEGDGQSVWWAEEWFNREVKVVHPDGFNGILYDANGKQVGRPCGGFNYASNDYLYFYEQDYSRVYFTSRSGQTFWISCDAFGLVHVKGNIVSALAKGATQRYLIDLDKREIISSDYKYVNEMIEGRVLVLDQNEKYGYLDKELNTVIEAQFKTATNFEYGVAAVLDDKGAYLINLDGMRVSDLYDKLTPIFEFKGLYFAERSGKMGVIDANNEVVLPIQYINNNGVLGIVPIADGAVRWSPEESVVLYGL